jgi:energy-coupling factor transporter ATP-binding protein EcfA2
MKLIALVGPAGCGKSTVAKILSQEFLYKRIKFSQPLKDMLLALGLTEAHTEGSLKSIPCDLLGGKTPRYAMQTLGTEWARDIMGKNFWANIWRTRVQKHTRGIQGRSVVTEDCRFENEAKLVRELGGEIWVIERPSYSYTGHSSETEMADIKSDLIIKNQGSVEELKVMVRGVLGRSEPSWSEAGEEGLHKGMC